jgi:hypothetical protein
VSASSSRGSPLGSARRQRPDEHSSPARPSSCEEYWLTITTPLSVPLSVRHIAFLTVCLAHFHSTDAELEVEGLETDIEAANGRVICRIDVQTRSALLSELLSQVGARRDCQRQ